MANAAYFKGGKESLRARDEEIAELNEKYDETIQSIVDPQPDVDLRDIPVMAAGLRALENARWEFEAQRDVQAMVG